MIVAGIGCRRDCAAEAIVDLVHAAAARAGQAPMRLAAPAFKSAEPGLLEAARVLGLTLTLVERGAMQQLQAATPTRSAAVARATGLASVAEAAALAGAGPGARLLLPRIAAGGATCALAVSA